MITGRQIERLGNCWNIPQPRLAERAKIKLAILIRAEATDGQPAISMANATAIQRALESAGAEFTDGDDPTVKLNT